MAHPQTDNGPKAKALNLRLDVPTHRRLQRAMEDRGFGFQALGETLIKEWLRHLEHAEPMDFTRVGDQAFARMVVGRKHGSPLAYK